LGIAATAAKDTVATVVAEAATPFVAVVVVLLLHLLYLLGQGCHRVYSRVYAFLPKWPFRFSSSFTCAYVPGACFSAYQQ
jgi:hypothetical protein